MPEPLEIRAIRRYVLRCTQAVMARQLGVTPRAVEHWECGTRRMPIATWRALTTRCASSGTVPCPAALKRARRLLRLTRAAASARVGIANRTWDQWEDGERTCPPAKWALVLHMLNLPPDFTEHYDPLKGARSVYSP
jgi:DNA-binding transcriptional regulator YiaG